MALYRIKLRSDDPADSDIATRQLTKLGVPFRILDHYRTKYVCLFQGKAFHLVQALAAISGATEDQLSFWERPFAYAALYKKTPTLIRALLAVLFVIVVVVPWVIGSYDIFPGILPRETCPQWIRGFLFMLMAIFGVAIVVGLSSALARTVRALTDYTEGKLV
jgi:hypothetical protein